MAMHNVAFLVSEIKDLRAMSARQKRKRETSRSYIASEEILIAKKEQNRVRRARIINKVVLSEIAAQASNRALSRCNMCSSLKHNARVCLTRIA